MGRTSTLLLLGVILYYKSYKELVIVTTFLIDTILFGEYIMLYDVSDEVLTLNVIIFKILLIRDFL